MPPSACAGTLVYPAGKPFTAAVGLLDRELVAGAILVRSHAPMPAARSMDRRERILRAWQNKEGTWQEFAERFPVGVATVGRLVARCPATGSVAPTVQKRGPEPLLGEEALAVLQRILAAVPDRTLPARQHHWQAPGWH